MIKTLFIYAGIDREELEKDILKGTKPNTSFFGFMAAKNDSQLQASYIQISKESFTFASSLVRNYRWLRLPYLFLKLRREFLSADVIVLMSSAYFELMLLSAIGLLRKKRWILLNLDLTTRFTAVAGDPKEKRALLGLIKRASVIISLSGVQRQFLIDLGLPLQELYFVELGVDMDYFHLLPPASDYLLTIGNDSGRDYDTFLRAMALMPEEQALMHCSPKNLESLTVPVPPTVEVQVNKTYADIREMYRKASMFVIAMKPVTYAIGSDCSGQTAILDSLAYGRPVIATDSPWLHDYFRHGTNIMIVPPEDPKALADAVKEVLSNGELQNRLVKEGRKLIEERCNSEAMGKAIARIISEAVSKG